MQRDPRRWAAHQQVLVSLFQFVRIRLEASDGAAERQPQNKLDRSTDVLVLVDHRRDPGDGANGDEADDEGAVANSEVRGDPPGRRLTDDNGRNGGHHEPEIIECGCFSHVANIG